MRRSWTLGIFLLTIALAATANAQLSQHSSALTKPDSAGQPPIIRHAPIASQSYARPSQPAPPVDPPAQPNPSAGDDNRDRGKGHGGHGHWHGGHSHGGRWHGGQWQWGGLWLWPVPVTPVIYPYFSTPAFFGYNPAFDYSAASYSTASSSVPLVNTMPVVPPAPTAAPGDAIKNTNAEQKARAGRFIGFGDGSFAKQKYLAALGRYKTAIETAPDMPDGYFRQGFAHVALGQYENAAKAFRRGLLVRSAWRGSPLRLDAVYGPAGDAAKLQHLERLAEAVAANSFDADLLLVLGVMLFFDGQVDRAELCFSRVSQLGGDSQGLLSDFMPRPKPAGAVDPPAKSGGKISF